MHLKFHKNGLTREVKIGFSWTIFFFGSIPLAFRGMWGWFFAVSLANCVTFGLFGLIFAFMANKKYAHWLAEKGWTVSPDDGQSALQAWGIRTVWET
ncbi:hypothetical protein HNQ50_000301 [Silvimonas terrae]|uniref:DUF2628 domain-containing protein n=1 Tax=Silvimonas terrae TaxID=300266 RepID=A0A840RBB5_9NEIS|nr:HrgC protein [Silvimonas terrae]MBB5189591.1 hypothetical protein [Silvimonas terrae]